MGSSIKEIEAGFSRIKRLCKGLKVFFNFSFYLCLALWLIALICIAANTFAPNFISLNLLNNTLTLIPVVIEGMLTACLLRIGFLVFRDIANGESPFTVKQANRVRYAAILFVAYAIFDLLWSPDIAYLVSLSDTSLGTWNESSPFTLHLNLGLIGAAVLFFSLSVVFQYGALLQGLSDETV